MHMPTTQFWVSNWNLNFKSTHHWSRPLEVGYYESYTRGQEIIDGELLFPLQKVLRNLVLKIDNQDLRQVNPPALPFHVYLPPAIYLEYHTTIPSGTWLAKFGVHKTSWCSKCGDAGEFLDTKSLETDPPTVQNALFVETYDITLIYPIGMNSRL